MTDAHSYRAAVDGAHVAVAAGPDLAAVVAGFGARLRAAGLPAGADRCERFAAAIATARPVTVDELRWCARATLAGDRKQQELLDRVFDEVFGGFADPAGDSRGDPNAADVPSERQAARSADGLSPSADAGLPDAYPQSDRDDNGETSERAVDAPTVASDVERLATRDFAELTEAELASLRAAMSSLTLATPTRRSRRVRRVAHGSNADLRATLRLAHRSGGDPLRIVRKRRREQPRRLVVLCDISGSMQAYARAMVQLLYCATGGRQAEVFTFATRLTRLTPVMAMRSPGVAMRKAGEAAPDWSGGTRIGPAIKDFIDRHGRAGMARGAVVVIVSDGWETGDAELLGRQMGRLSGLAHRIVWVNPRTARPGYRPLAGGMAAAWPHCDAVVSAHRLTALSELTRALSDPNRKRVRPQVKESK